MQHKDFKKKNNAISYAKDVVKYHFSPKLRSALTILYFLFFSYFVIFYISHVFLAIRFAFGTLFSSTVVLGPDHMIWGSIFIACLTIPFLASITALALPYEMKKRAWPRATRFVLAGIIAIVTISFNLFVDFTLGYVEKRAPIENFMESKGIVIPQ